MQKRRDGETDGFGAMVERCRHFLGVQGLIGDWQL